jgi:hypothetical protein
MPFLVETIPAAAGSCIPSCGKAGRLHHACPQPRLFGCGFPVLAAVAGTCIRQTHPLRRGDLGRRNHNEMKSYRNEHVGFRRIRQNYTRYNPAQPRRYDLRRCRRDHMCLRFRHRARRVENNYRVILMSDGVVEVSRETHASELKTGELNTALGQLLRRQFRPPPGTRKSGKPLPASS